MHGIALGAQEVVRELGGVGITLGEQDGGSPSVTVGPRPRARRDARLPDLASSLGKQAVGVGWLQTAVDLLADEAELINLIAAVQSPPA
jgi:hypothetical protein